MTRDAYRLFQVRGDSGNLKLGLCLPDSCNTDDLKAFMTFGKNHFKDIKKRTPI